MDRELASGDKGMGSSLSWGRAVCILQSSETCLGQRQDL